MGTPATRTLATTKITDRVRMVTGWTPANGGGFSLPDLRADSRTSRHGVAIGVAWAVRGGSRYTNIVFCMRTSVLARATTVIMFEPGHSGRSVANASDLPSLPPRFER